MRLTLNEKTARKLKRVKNWKTRPDLDIAREMEIPIEAVSVTKLYLKKRKV